MQSKSAEKRVHIHRLGTGGGYDGIKPPRARDGCAGRGDVVRRQRICLLFRRRDVSARGVDGDHQRGARGRRDCVGVRDRARRRNHQWFASSLADVRREPEQERAYQTLIDNEKMARAIIEEALDAFVQTDGNCVVLNWSPHAEALDGLDARGGHRPQRGETAVSGIAAGRSPAVDRSVPERGQRRGRRRTLRDASAAQGRQRILRRGVAHGAAPQ